MIPLIMPPLAGLTVLVTRPAIQAQGLCEQIEKLGGTALRLPLLHIKPLAIAPLAESYDLLLFISTNAVIHGQALIAAQPQARLAAVGAATAQALLDLGHAIDVVPHQAASSEALLAHPLLQSPPPNILIVRGNGGRELLRETLQARGSAVAMVEVYERVEADLDTAQVQAVQAALQAGDVDVISITSVAILQALLSSSRLHASAANPSLHEYVLNCTLLAGSARIAAAAKQAGWSGQYVIARSPEDSAMIDALTDWHTRAR